MILRLLTTLFISLSLLSSGWAQETEHSIAREWNEINLQLIRQDFARPTVHARNLFHVAIAMYDGWAAYDHQAQTYFLGKETGGYFCAFDGIPTPTDLQKAREETISYAAFRILNHRFRNSPNTGQTLYDTEIWFTELGYDPNFQSTAYQDGNPAALGNYIASEIINYGLQDGANEQFFYENQVYEPVNESLVTDRPGNPNLTDPNRWQPLTLDIFIDQSGNERPINTPDFLSPEWGQVTPFSLQEEDATIYNRDGFDYKVYHDPGLPPFLNTTDSLAWEDNYKWGFALVAVWGSMLDPDDGVMWDISPGSIGNIDFDDFPRNFDDMRDFYDLTGGGDISRGWDVNPHTGLPYEPQMVPRADYARVLAEFWADGPDSETPPGHWFTILNYVNDHPDFERRYRGKGDALEPLEWDVKAYLNMGGAMHDCAIAAWGIKGYYDYLRPISAIRYMGDLGQSSAPNLPSYHPGGLPLLEGYIELVEEGDPLAGEDNEHVGKIKLYTWRGPDYIPFPQNTYAGVGWILSERWFPYQRPSFVTPPFAGYVSGHSTYSRAAAEVMTLMTGDEYFPGGMGVFDAPKNEFLVFEDGPSVNMKLQWATYRDASEQCSLSRIWGGIHPPADDIPGRIIGEKIGVGSFRYAEQLFFSDNDNDGFLSNVDCDDNDANVNPNAEEVPNNDVDEDCDGVALVIDNDMDGFNSDEDCDDENADINANATEIPNNDVDEDCDGVALVIDNDMDGFNSDEDCDDDNAAINANATEIPNNDVDEDCDGVALVIDNDMDGFNSDEDCDDNDANINPNAPEVANNDIDENCDGVALVIDNDMDGFNSDEDCNDEDATINPDAEDIANNGIDEDCDGQDFVSAIHEIDGQQLNIYPNPVAELLYVDLENVGNYTARLFSITGQLQLVQNLNVQSNQLTISTLENGIYLLEITNLDTNNRAVEKVQIVR